MARSERITVGLDGKKQGVVGCGRQGQGEIRAGSGRAFQDKGCCVERFKSGTRLKDLGVGQGQGESHRNGKGVLSEEREVGVGTLRRGMN